MRNILIKILLGMILIQIFYVAFGLVVNPYSTGDAYAIWFLKAKAISDSSNLADFVSFLKDTRYIYSHPEYPLLWPILLSGVGKTTSAWMFVYPIIFSLLIYFSYKIVSEKTNRLSGLLAAFSVSTVITLERMAGRYEVGFADLPLALFFLLTCYVYLKNRINWPLLALLMGLTANIKFEGLLAMLIFVFLVKPKEKMFWVIFTPLLVFWPIVTSFLHLQNIYSDNLSMIFILDNVERLPTILVLLAKEVLNWRNYGLWLVIFFSSLFLRGDKKNKVIAIWTSIYLLCLAASYFFTPLPIVSHWNTSFYRIVTAMMPIIIVNSFIMILCDSKKKS